MATCPVGKIGAKKKAVVLPTFHSCSPVFILFPYYTYLPHLLYMCIDAYSCVHIYMYVRSLSSMQVASPVSNRDFLSLAPQCQY